MNTSDKPGYIDSILLAQGRSKLPLTHLLEDLEDTKSDDLPIKTPVLHTSGRYEMLNRLLLLKVQSIITSIHWLYIKTNLQLGTRTASWSQLLWMMYPKTSKQQRRFDIERCPPSKPARWKRMATYAANRWSCTSIISLLGAPCAGVMPLPLCSNPERTLHKDGGKGNKQFGYEQGNTSRQVPFILMLIVPGIIIVQRARTSLDIPQRDPEPEELQFWSS